MSTAALAAPQMRKPKEDRVPIDPAKLKRLREDRGLSFAAMADASGMSETNYRALEAGERDPKLSQVIGLLRVLSLSYRDLPRMLLDDAHP